MVDPFAEDPVPTTSSGTERARAELNARFQHLRQDAEEAAAEIKERPASGASGSASSASDAGPASSWSSADFRAQAAQAADQAKGAAASVAEQARARLVEIVDQQKVAGAARVAGVAQAAQSAARDLDATNPELARLVRSAAEGVDRIASDIRGRTVGDVVDTLATFGRRQPVAFFGSAVLAGFLIARFIKSDAPVIGDEPAAHL